MSSSGVFAGVLVIASLLLLGAGLAKLARPSPTAEALSSLGLTCPPGVVRGGAALEAVVGMMALVTAWWPSVVVMSASYLCFAGFVVAVRRSPEASSCGCFGRRGVPPTRRHVVLDLALAAGSALAAATGAPGMRALALHSPAVVAPFVAVCLAGAWLAYLLVETARREVPR